MMSALRRLGTDHGVSGYEPLRRNRRQRLDELKTGDGRPLPPPLKGQSVVSSIDSICCLGRSRGGELVERSTSVNPGEKQCDQDQGRQQCADDQHATIDIGDALAPLDLEARAFDAALRSAFTLSKRWLAMPPIEMKSLVLDIVERVTVAANRIDIWLNRAKIAAALEAGGGSHQGRANNIAVSAH